MKTALLILALSAGIIFAGEELEISDLKLKMTGPEKFTKLPDPNLEIPFLGPVKGLFASPDNATMGASVLIHHMTLSDQFTDFDALKSGLSDGLAAYYGEHYKL